MSAEITEEEKKDPFYKYYTEDLAPLEPEQQAVLDNGPMNPSGGCMPAQAGKILLDLDPAYPMNGYCVLDNGVGYSSALIHQDGITDEMFELYTKEFGHTENRRLMYKLWYPHMHMIHFEDGIVENWGYGFCLQEMKPSYCDLATFGISVDEIKRKDPGCIGFLGIGGDRIELSDPTETRRAMTMLQYTRPVPGGRELRVLYWNGAGFNENKELVLQPGADRKKTEEEMRLMYQHCVQEYQNQNRLIRWYAKDRL